MIVKICEIAQLTRATPGSSLVTIYDDNYNYNDNYKNEFKLIMRLKINTL